MRRYFFRSSRMDEGNGNEANNQKNNSQSDCQNNSQDNNLSNYPNNSQSNNQGNNQNSSGNGNQANNQNNSGNSNQGNSENNNQINKTEVQIPIGTNLNDNTENLKNLLGQPNDLIIREIKVGSSQKTCAIVYLNVLVDQNLVNTNMTKIVQSTNAQEIMAISEMKNVTTVNEIAEAVLSGNMVLMLDGATPVWVMDTAGGDKRTIDEPQSEPVIRGPRSGFVENIDTNIALIRRELKDSNLRFEVHEVGERSKQKLVVCYVEGITNKDILNEVNRRLKSIDIDFAPDSSFVEQWIEDSSLSPFPQILDTERPERVTYSILQGKVAILVNGSPFALVTPITLGYALQSIDDYSQRWIIGSLLRLLRFIATFLTIFLPAVYVALISYHPGLIPTQLAFSIAATREGVPFPSIFEALLMAVTFEILEEAGIRLPKGIGQTVGIVGGIVIGDVAVSAGIVSPAMVLVTSLTAIASFTIPNYSTAVSLRVLRFALIFAAAVLGLYGIILVFIMMIVHLVNLKSMGVPYTGPFAPYFLGDLKNVFIRAPVMTLTKRPPYLETEDTQKVNNGGQDK